MKNRYPFFVLFIGLMMCVALSCKKKPEDAGTELSKLPPATQTGANTFGALVNGQAFTPYKDPYSSGASYQCNYIYTNGGYYLIVAGSKQVGMDYYGLVLNTSLLPVNEGATLKLENYNESGKASGTYYLISATTTTYQTTTYVNGQLYISHFDQAKQIISGTFFFNAITSKGDTVRVTDGRFDMRYTQ